MRKETEPDEDAQLMLAFQQGDEACFDRLFHKYKTPLVRFAARFTNRRDVAEELAQEVFVKCYLARRSYQPTARYSTWLFRIARNHCLNEVRRQDYRFRSEPLADAPGGGGATPEELARAGALQRALELALDALPESQRTALVLCRFHGMSYDEIAATMETSVSAVKALVNRARGTLLKRLAGHLEARDEL